MIIMKDQLVTFETAKLAKEKGFDWYTLHYRQQSSVIGDDTILPLDKDSSKNLYNWNNFSENVPYYSIPTQSLLQKWLREKHNIDVLVNQYIYKGGNYFSHIISEEKDFDLDPEKTYEQGLEKGLQEALKLI